jgi:hypothetical protein
VHREAQQHGESQQQQQQQQQHGTVPRGGCPHNTHLLQRLSTVRSTMAGSLAAATLPITAPSSSSSSSSSPARHPPHHRPIIAIISFPITVHTTVDFTTDGILWSGTPMIFSLKKILRTLNCIYTPNVFDSSHRKDCAGAVGGGRTLA